MRHMRHLLLAPVFMLASAAQAQAVYQTNTDMSFNPGGIAHCANSGGGQATRGEMPTGFANQFWSRATCRDWSGAFDLLEQVPKDNSTSYPNPYAKETPWTKCFWESFPFGNDARHGEDAYGTKQVIHGTFVIEAERFDAIRKAAAAACSIKLGLRQG